MGENTFKVSLTKCHWEAVLSGKCKIEEFLAEQQPDLYESIINPKPADPSINDPSNPPADHPIN